MSTPWSVRWNRVRRRVSFFLARFVSLQKLSEEVQEELANRLHLVASPDGAEGSLTIHQDARIFLSQLAGGESVTQPMSTDRFAWLQVLRGNAKLNGMQLYTGDGAAVREEKRLEITAAGDCEVMLFDLS